MKFDVNRHKPVNCDGKSHDHIDEATAKVVRGSPLVDHARFSSVMPPNPPGRSMPKKPATKPVQKPSPKAAAKALSTKRAPVKATAKARAKATAKVVAKKAKATAKVVAKKTAAVPIAVAAAVSAPEPTATLPPPVVTAPARPLVSKLPTSVPEVKAAIERQIRATLLKDVTFSVGDKVVHPAHGVGEVTSIEKRDIGGQVSEFYVLKILEKGMKVMVPTGAAGHVGLRRIMSGSEAEEILETIRAREVAVDVQPWSRRFRIYTEMVNSGAASEIAKVFRDMNRLKFDKDLSFGERKLLDQARSLLLKELAFAKNQPEAEMAKDLQQIFTS